MSDFFDNLEAELRTATVRRAAAARAGRALSASRRRTAALAVAAAATVLIAAPALAPVDGPLGGLFGDGGSPLAPPEISLAAVDPQLVASLGALRREQKPVDLIVPTGVRGSAKPQRAPAISRLTRAHEALARLNEQTRDLARLLRDNRATLARDLVPFAVRDAVGPGAQVLLRGMRSVARGRWGWAGLIPIRPAKAGAAGDRIVLFVRSPRPRPANERLAPTETQVDTVSVVTRAAFERRGMCVLAAGSSRAVLVQVVPDGVAHVQAVFKDLSQPDGKVRVQRRVRDNAVEIPVPPTAVGDPVERWLDDDGSTVKVVRSPEPVHVRIRMP